MGKTTAVLGLSSVDICRRGDCALAVCQGRTIYPADDVEERRKRRRGRRRRAGVSAVRHAVGSCSS